MEVSTLTVCPLVCIIQCVLSAHKLSQSEHDHSETNYNDGHFFNLMFLGFCNKKFHYKDLFAAGIDLNEN